MNKKNCSCDQHGIHQKRIVITGGPGAGKTALLEIARKKLCEHVAILPEAATIIFTGGFWRHSTVPSRKATQRAIFHIQRELEQMVEEEGKSSAVLCDRGTIDGLAYWPAEEDLFWKDVKSTKEKELERYAVVIHLRTPIEEHGYNHDNPVRTETATEAQVIDRKIEEAWRDHPKRFIVESGADFLIKVAEAMEILRKEIPYCCQN